MSVVAKGKMFRLPAPAQRKAGVVANHVAIVVPDFDDPANEIRPIPDCADLYGIWRSLCGTAVEAQELKRTCRTLQHCVCDSVGARLLRSDPGSLEIGRAHV